MHPGRIAAAALPALALAAIGLLHPVHVGDDPARWTAVHVVGLVVFPLLGLAPWVVAHDRGRAVGVVLAVLGYGYAAGYTALDVIAGVANGVLVAHGTAAGAVLYPLANAFGVPAAAAYLAATVLAVLASVGRSARLVVPGGVLVLAAAVSFLTSHITPPRGVLTMVAFALGWALLAAAARRPAYDPGAADPQRAGSTGTTEKAG